MVTLGKLEKVNLRTAWKNEAKDFTVWLAQEENLTILGDEIGFGLKLVKTEADVGKFSVDILAEDEDDPNHKVIIENQLEKTDHDHLGKIITYASGYDAKTVIWIAETFQDEHKQAIHWLNERTDEGTNFFAIEMELWKIGDSDPAPKFSIVAQPNGWAKEVKTQGELTNTNLKQLAFWEGFNQYAKDSNSPLRMHKPRPQHWHNIAVGDSRAHISLIVLSSADTMGCDLYIPDNKPLFAQLENHKEHIGNELPYELDWRPLATRKASRIVTRSSIDFDDEPSWTKAFEWLLEVAERFHKVFGKYIKKAP